MRHRASRGRGQPFCDAGRSPCQRSRQHRHGQLGPATAWRRVRRGRRGRRPRRRARAGTSRAVARGPGRSGSPPALLGDSAATAARAVASRAAAAGSRSGQTRGGGGPSAGTCSSGSSSSARSRARPRASTHWSLWRREPRPVNVDPGQRALEARHRDRSLDDRAVRKDPAGGGPAPAPTVAGHPQFPDDGQLAPVRIRCIPDVRRQGSTRGGVGGARRSRRTPPRPPTCPASSSAASASRRSTSTSTSRAA